MEQKKWSLQIGGRILEIETGLLAGQANGAVTVRYGDTVVLAAAVMSKEAVKGKGYFPLMVDFEERYYAAGKIKGSKFIKREGRPSDEAILSGRLVDRTIRPLFDSRLRNEVQVVITVLSYDGENDPAVAAIIAASCSLAFSDVPWKGPVGAVRVGKINGELVLNPVGNGELQESQLDLVISGTGDKINMVEAGAKEVPEEEIVKALAFGQDAIRKICDFILSIQKETGKEKSEGIYIKGTPEFEAKIRQILDADKLADILYSRDNKKTIYSQIEAIRDKTKSYIKNISPQAKQEDIDWLSEIAEQVFEEYCDEVVHKNILEKETRPDGRGLLEIRPISCKAGVLPRTHGSALFTRGETQALTVTTLGSPGDQQIIDTMELDTEKRYIHLYNFPPFSTGEIKPMRGPGRREIGHGALAERALLPVIPSKEEFPYTILVVSEILSSNGSSSMAATCGSTLSLMDAGVPIKKPVAGIAMGIITTKRQTTNNQQQYKILTDIQGLEDHYGDMDFKVAGTKDGITALQMDVKIDGLSVETLEKALFQAKINRMEILEKILATIPEPRKEMSQYAPRIITLHINPDKIRNVIGTGGKIINEIIDRTGVEIDIEDDGSVFITSPDESSAKKAVEWIDNLTHEVKPGEIFNGRITRIMNFGAFAEILPGQEGLIHISELADYRVERVEDIVHIGDIVPVKVKNIDDQGRINLSLKDAARIMR
jgi:polyribonucleotide nucleotidyltransferase